VTTGPCSSKCCLWHLVGGAAELTVLLLFFCLFVRWSHDSKYVARMSENLLSVYDVPVSNRIEVL